MANPNIGEKVAAIIADYSKTAADNMSRSNILLSRLKERGKIKPFGGGLYVREILEYANGVGGSFSGYETLNNSPKEILDAADFDLKQYYAAISMSSLELAQASGKNALVDLWEAKIENGYRTLENFIAVGLYSAGTNAKDLAGLQLMVANTPTTGTYGKIDRSVAANAFWRNQAFSAATDGGAATSASNIQHYLNVLWAKTVRGSDKPDLLLSDNNNWIAYLESLQPIQRVQNSKLADAGFDNIKYMSADFVCDGGFQGFSTDPMGVGGVPANTTYLLDTRYIRFRPHSDFNMVASGPRIPIQQAAQTEYIFWTGAFTATNCFLQAVLAP